MHLLNFHALETLDLFSAWRDSTWLFTDGRWFNSTKILMILETKTPNCMDIWNIFAWSNKIIYAQLNKNLINSFVLLIR